MRGVFVNGSPCVVAGGKLHRLPATAQTVREWAAELASLPPCPHCGLRGGCDCLGWIEWMSAGNAAAMEGENESN